MSTEPRRSGSRQAGQPLLRAHDLHGVYRSGTTELHAVDQVSLSLDEGEVIGLAGESGSGKSTLGAILSLTARPPLHVDDGTLEVDGRSLALDGSQGIPRTWRGSVVSLLPQGAMNSISPTMRVRDLVVDVVKAHDRRAKKSEAIDRARDRFEVLGLPVRSLDAYPHQLSGGMKQRTVTVISTLLNPQILIADEPTSALDVTSQKALIDMLADMLEKKIMSGVIFITHDIPVLRTVSDRLAIMHRGKIVETGMTDEMIDDPRHPYTKALLGSVLVPEPKYRKLRIEGMKGFEDAPTAGRAS